MKDTCHWHSKSCVSTKTNSFGVSVCIFKFSHHNEWMMRWNQLWQRQWGLEKIVCIFSCNCRISSRAYLKLHKVFTTSRFPYLSSRRFSSLCMYNSENIKKNCLLKICRYHDNVPPYIILNILPVIVSQLKSKYIFHK
jgi:hypothetical protein